MGSGESETVEVDELVSGGDGVFGEGRSFFVWRAASPMACGDDPQPGRQLVGLLFHLASAASWVRAVHGCLPLPERSL